MGNFDKTFWYLVGQNSNEPRGPSSGGGDPGCLALFLAFFVFFFIPGWIMVTFNAGSWLFILVLGIMILLLWRSVKNNQKKKLEQEKLEQEKHEQEKLNQEKLEQEKQDDLDPK